MKQVAWAVCACLAVSSAGCSSAEMIARKRRDRIQVGMTQTEVRDRIGGPDTRVTGGPGEDWIFRYSAGPDSAIEYALAVVAFVVVLGILVAARGHGANFGSGGAGCEFKVSFNAAGRVVCISGLRTVRP
jgi:hypothetical protein